MAKLSVVLNKVCWSGIEHLERYGLTKESYDKAPISHLQWFVGRLISEELGQYSEPYEDYLRISTTWDTFSQLDEFIQTTYPYEVIIEWIEDDLSTE
jgi:hypothetical protein